MRIKQQRKVPMKKLDITFAINLLVLDCFCLSLSLQAADDSRQSAKVTQIDVPGALFTVPNAINARGEIVGLYLDGSFTVHGFLLSNGTFTTIDGPGANLTIALGINARGDIVGAYRDSSRNINGYLLSNGDFTTVDVPRTTFTVLDGINSKGDIVGEYRD